MIVGVWLTSCIITFHAIEYKHIDIECTIRENVLLQVQGGCCMNNKTNLKKVSRLQAALSFILK